MGSSQTDQQDDSQDGACSVSHMGCKLRTLVVAQLAGTHLVLADARVAAAETLVMCPFLNKGES